MRDKNSVEWMYAYEVGPFSRLFVPLLSAGFAVGGLQSIAIPVANGAVEESLFSVAAGAGFLIVAVILLRWLYRNSQSSKSVRLFADRVQLPMTKGDDDGDYLSFHDVLDTIVERELHDHGPALIVSTQSKPVAYKSMYFDGYRKFEDFCDRFESAIEAFKYRQA
ncbi:hypothetical protein NBRC116594_34550 [Shimia sp. NS0008-38b]|uniref:hypothetical protein n=1 Tax=Shimia sp. NS0008-38b TaxID=3127653 RepID=UPI003106A213